MKFNPTIDEMQLLVSIVIPTKNRAHYAKHTIEACLKLAGPCEVIVVDNSLDSSLENDSVILLNPDRLKYIRIKESHSVVDNFNMAIAAASAPYITCIGDDDIVTSEIFDVAKFAQTNHIEAVNFSYPVTYWWPDFNHRRRGSIDAGSVSIEHYSCRVFTLDPLNELKKAMEKLGSGPLNMPRAYAGLVSKNLVQRILEKYGNLFGGVSPDVYSSTLLAYECKGFLYIDYPVIVPGISGASTSGTSSNGRHVGRLSDHEHINAFKSLKWDSRVPDFYSVPTVWGYSMLAALKKLHLDTNANLMSIYIKCLIFHHRYFSSILSPLKSAIKDRAILTLFKWVLISVINEVAYICNAIIKRAGNKFFPGRTERYVGLSNSCSASCVIETKLAESNSRIAWPTAIAGRNE